jgi:two-component system NtrC family sensor kinase
MKIANKISFSFFIIFFICIVSTFCVIYLIVKVNISQVIADNLDSVVRSRAKHIETYLKMLEISVGQLSKSVVLENFLIINSKEDPQQSEEAFKRAMRRLKNTKEVNPAIAEFLLLDKSGKVVVSSNESSIGLDVSTDVFFLNGQKESYIKDVYYSEEFKAPLMVVSTPLLNSQTGALLGVFAARVRLNELNNIVIERTGMGKTGEIYIVNQHGFMITPSRFKEDVILKQKVDAKNIGAVSLHENSEQVLLEKRMLNVFLDYRGVLVLGGQEYIPQMRWSVLAEINVKEAFASLVKLRLVFLMVFFMVLIVTWALGILVAQVITGPLHKLYKGTEIIGSGNLDYKIGTDVKDEVGQLSRAFDAMAANLKTSTISIESLYKEITERKKVQNALQNNKDLLFEMTTRIPGVVYQFYVRPNKEMGFYYISNRSEQVLGLKPDLEGYFERFAALVIPEHRESFIKSIEKSVRELSEWKYEGMLQKPSGEKAWFSGNSIPSPRENEVIFNGVVFDITERKRTEEALSQALKKEIKSREILTSMLEDNNRVREKLEKNMQELRDSQAMLGQSEKLASLGRLVSDMAHEVNNPLMIISGNAQLSLLDESLNEELKNNLKIIHEECNRAKSIIQRLLMFSRPSKGEQKPVDINQSIEFVLKLIEHQFGLSDVKISSRFNASLPLISADEKQIQEVIMNLLNNARDAMPTGGEITINTSLDSEYLKINIKDSGVGMDDKTLTRVFEPFFTTKEKGTGLGLSVCYGIIKAHSGKIEVKSQPQKGTTVHVWLPLKAEGA